MKLPKTVSFVVAVGCLMPIVTLPGCTEIGPFGPFDLSDCGDLCDEREPPPEVKSFWIEPRGVTLSVGQRTTIKAFVILVNGSRVESPGVRWSSSDTTVVALSDIIPGPTREVIARAVGEASIKAFYRQESAVAKVIVN